MRTYAALLSCLVFLCRGSSVLRSFQSAPQLQQTALTDVANLLLAFSPSARRHLPRHSHQRVENSEHLSLRQQSHVSMDDVPLKVALLFDCDGVLVETEELHRVAYNMAFDEFGLEIDGKPVHWSGDYYSHLANTVGGGKPKMRYHFTGLGAPTDTKLHPDVAKVWPVAKNRGFAEFPSGTTPESETMGMELIDELQEFKTDCYKSLVAKANPRPGVLELMDSAIKMPGLAVGICSASSRGGFEKLVDSIVGKDRLSKLDVIIAGDDVTHKKPHPEIYNVAAKRLGLANEQCVVVEDSITGLRAAKAANMKCIITYTEQTEAEDFYGNGADAKLLDFSKGVTASDVFPDGLVVSDELLASLRDPK